MDDMNLHAYGMNDDWMVNELYATKVNDSCQANNIMKIIEMHHKHSSPNCTFFMIA